MSSTIISSEKRKNARPLDTIAGEIHQVQRVSVFAVGDLLIEARAACEYGDWLDWLDQNFEWSEDSADRYMKVARLDSATLRNLKLAKTTLYALLDEDEDDLPVIIQALAKHATRKQLKPSDANVVIAAALLRKRFGDLPDQTLVALDNLPEPRPWYDRAVAAFKEQRPTTEEGAAEIVAGIQLAHVTELYAPHGKMPNIPTEELRRLEDVPEGRRAKVLDRLLKAHQPITSNDVFNAIYSSGSGPSSLGDGDAGDTSADDHGDGPEPETPTEPSQQESSLDPELLTALQIILKHARRPVPKVVHRISGEELGEVVRFAEELHKVQRAGSSAKIAADRAEACSRSKQSAAEPHPLDIPPSLIRTQDAPDPGPDVDRWIER